MVMKVQNESEGQWDEGHAVCHGWFGCVPGKGGQGFNGGLTTLGWAIFIACGWVILIQVSIRGSG